MEYNYTYLAGPMRGYPLYNFPTFITVGNILRSAGVHIINPAEMDLAAGVDPEDTETAPCIRSALARDTVAICGCKDVVLLPGWEKSHGVWVELTLAMELGLAIYEITDVTDELNRIIFKPISYAEIYERTRELHRPRTLSKVQQPEQPSPVCGRLCKVFQRWMWTLGIFAYRFQQGLPGE